MDAISHYLTPSLALVPFQFPIFSFSPFFCCNSPLCCLLFFLPTPAFCGVFTVPCRRPQRLRPSANDKNQPKQQQRQKPRQDNNNNKKKPQKQQQGKSESCADAPARNVDAKLEQRQQRIPAGCTFTALLKFPSSFPSYPPTMTFLTDILHPNIDTSGKVCISILHPPGIDPLGYEQASERWNCDRTVESILVSIQLLLAEPNFNSPANVDAAVLFRSDPERYREEVRRRVEIVMTAPTQPEGQGTTQSPEEQRAQPPEEQRAQPPEEQRAQPPEEQRAQPPEEQRAQPPEQQGTTQAAEEQGTQPPEQQATTQPPEQQATTQPPEQQATTQPPEQQATTQPPEQQGTTQAAEEQGAQPPEQQATTQPPEQQATTQPPEQQATTQPPEQQATTQPPEGQGTTQPPATSPPEGPQQQTGE
ncbi:hypothetical protein niasHT_001880 [Heterodera trifolii]|uniref:UBC core domain-containing protein n=1 Tax=Heterodera trifolii TaxID=157864 RepID=A0ABD2LNH3_9BILA